MKILKFFSLTPEPSLDPYLPPKTQRKYTLFINSPVILIRLLLIGLVIVVTFFITLTQQVLNKRNKLTHAIAMECALGAAVRVWLFLFGFSKIKYKNIKLPLNEHLRRYGNHITISNHPCPLDGPLLMSSMGRKIMGSIKTLDLWFIGYIFKAMESIQVDRYCKTSKHILLKNIVTGDLSLKDHHLFVEGKLGSVVDGKQYILKWASGAFCSNMPIAAYFISFSNKEKLEYTNFRNKLEFFSFINTNTEVTIEFIGEYKPTTQVRNKIERIRNNKNKLLNEGTFESEFRSLLKEVELWKNNMKLEYAKKSNSIISAKDRFDMIIISTGLCKDGTNIFNKYVLFRDLQKKFGKIPFLEYLDLIKTMKKIVENNKAIILENVGFNLDDVIVKYKNKAYKIKEFNENKSENKCLIKVVDSNKQTMHFDIWVFILMYIGIKYNAIEQCKKKNINTMMKEINKVYNVKY
eukprot:GAHX01000649.1.p1 GENE.GAHX01000649.1~~GAHX01000649.1.p1  ORF type:complete len:464 (-),score=92.45 GAHX01000649.1:75-1466(-)